MKKNLRISYNAPVTLSFVVLCFIATVMGVVSQGHMTELFFSVYRSAATNILAYVRLFGHVLGHVNFEHFFNNTLFLLLLGPMLEEKYGSKTILKLIAITALITGIFHCVLFGNTALCGASGIVFAFIVLSSFTKFSGREIPLTFILVIVLYVGKEIYSGIVIQDNISNCTHIIGGIIGGAMGYYLNREK